MYWSKQIMLDELIKQGNIALDRGRVISSIDLVKYPGDYPVYSSSAKKNGYFGSYNRFDFDEELITWSVDGGGYFFHRPKHKFSVTNVSGILHILNKDKFDYKFLFYVLDYQHKNQIFDYVDKAHPSIIRKRYFIPEINIVEQQKIAEIVSKVDVVIRDTEKLIAKYSRIKIGLMQDLLTSGVDENGVIRSEETHEFKDSPLGRIPKEWNCAALYKGLNHISDYRGKTPPYTDSGVPVISAESVKDGELRKTSKFVTNKTYDLWLTREIPEAGDVIFTTEAPVGEIALFPEKDKYLLTRRVIAFNCNKNKLLSRFLYFLLLDYKDNGVWNKYKIGSTVPRILKDDIVFQDIVYPDEKEQLKIIKIIDLQRSRIEVEKSKLHKYESIKSGLMQDLLSGKKRV
jgi:type I restriction enzyme S subunit